MAKKKTNRQIMEHNTQQKKLKAKQHEPHQKLEESEVLRIHIRHPRCVAHVYYKCGNFNYFLRAKPFMQKKQDS